MRRKPEPTPWRNAIVRYADEAPESLLANPQNWRLHPREQTAALNGSLTSLGWIAPVIVNETTQHVVDGHARIGEAIARGEPSVPVAYVNLTEDQERLALATFDPIAAMAGTDQQMLDDLLSGLSAGDAGLDALLASLASEQPKTLNPDDADLTPPAEPITKPGDLWLLGEHRLLCGDSTKPEDVARVLGGEQPELLLTDPPYNAGFDYGEQVDDKRDDYPEWCMSWFEPNVRLAHRTILTVGESNLGLWLRCAPWREHIGAWVKGSSAVAHSRVTQFVGWEPILFYGSDKWPRTRHLDVFEHEAGAVPRLGHPCPKPLTLWVELIECCTQVGDLVFDLFSGAGTTLVAAEQSSRRACALEIEPSYVDVAVRRWEHVTGRKAERG